MSWRQRCVLALAHAGLALGWISPAAAECRLEREWERFLEVPGIGTAEAGLAPSPELGALRVGAWLIPLSAAAVDRAGIALFDVSPGGDIRLLFEAARTDIGFPQAKTVQLTGLFDLATAGGRTLLPAEGDGGVLLWLEGGANGRLKGSRALAVEPDSQIHRLLPLRAGGLLGLGRQSSSALALRLTPEGEIERRWVEPLGTTSRFVDGIEQADDRLVLLANAGRYDMLYRGSSKVQLRQLAVDGTLIKEVSYRGRFGSLLALPDGSLAMAYDQAEDTKQSIVLQSYDQGLNLLWEQLVTSSSVGASHFRTALLPDGSILVVGAKDSLLYLAAFSRQGERLWEQWRPDDQPAGTSYRVAVIGDAVYVAGSSFLFEEGAGRSVRQVIRLLRYTCGTKVPSQP